MGSCIPVFADMTARAEATCYRLPPTERLASLHCRQTLTKARILEYETMKAGMIARSNTTLQQGREQVRAIGAVPRDISVRGHQAVAQTLSSSAC